MTEQVILAPCGLDCGPCPIRCAAHDAGFAEKLAEDWRSWNPDARADWFRCRGCKGDDSLAWGDDCKIRDCCLKQRQLSDCSRCDDFPCAKIIEFEEDEHLHHTEAVANLRRIRAERA